MKNIKRFYKSTQQNRFPLFGKFATIFAIFLLSIPGFSQNPVMKVFEEWRDTAGTQNTFYKAVTRTIPGTSNSVVVGATKNSSGNYDMLVQKLNSSGGVIWAHQYDGAGHGDDAATDVQIDGSGNVYITGSEYVNNTTNFNDAITIKYNSSGTQQWVSTYNGNGSFEDGTVAMSLDKTGGYVFVVGSEWDGSTNQYDMVVLDYKMGTGGQQWVTTFDDANWEDLAYRVAYDNSTSSVYVGGGSEPNSSGKYDYSVLNIDASSGSINASNTLSLSPLGIDKITDLQIDGHGNAYITGSAFNGASYDYLTARLDTSLVPIWTAQWDDASGLDDIATGLDIDSKGNVIVTGSSQTASNGSDYTTIKYDSTGAEIWEAAFNDVSNGSDSATGIVVKDTNQIYVTGRSFNGSTNDYYTIKYDENGTQIWEIGFNSFVNGEDAASTIAIDTVGGIIVTGQVRNADTVYNYSTVKYVEKKTTLPQDTIALTSNSFVFTENRGQLMGTDSVIHPEVRYYTINGAPQVFFTDTIVSYVLAKIDSSVTHHDTLCRVDMKFKGSNSGQRIRPMDERSDYYNFYLAHIPDGRGRVENYNQLVSFNVWNHVDVVYGSNLKGLKYYFICKPGGGGNNATQIDLKYSGADSVKINGSGQLVIYTKFGNIVQPKAAAWQLDGSGNYTSLGWQPSYNIVATNEVQFTSFGTLNTSYPIILAIDLGYQSVQSIANIEWSTYYGGTGDEVFFDSKTDAAANLYVTGYTNNNNFPTSNAYQPSNAGSSDVITGKFDQSGVRLWMTYFGGTASETGYGVAVDPTGNVFTTGYSVSTNFPTVNFGGTSHFQSYSGGGYADAVIFKLNPAGNTCTWSTYYGGTYSDQAYAVECDASGNIFITGTTESSNFPNHSLGGGAYAQAFGGPSGSDKDAFIVKFNAVTLDNDWATYYGGTSAVTEEGRNITIDPAGDVVVVGTTESSTFPTYNPGGGAYYDATLGGGGDAFLLRFSNTGVRQWATYYGGSTYEAGNGVGVNAMGDIFATGKTSSSDFPLLSLGGAYNQASWGGNGNSDAFILNFSGSSFARQWATYYGGVGSDEGKDIDLDQFGNLYISGNGGTGFPFPTVPSGAYTQSWQGGSNGDAFIGSFNASTMSAAWGSYLGGTFSDYGYSVTVDPNGKLFLIGGTASTVNFPLDNGAGIPYYQGTYGGLFTDGYITRFDLTPVLGVSEINTNESNALSLYPNPTNGQLFVNYSGLKGDLKFTIYNMLGEVVRTVDVGNTYGSASHSFDLTDITAGVYFVQAQCNGQVTSKKFIKQ